MMLFNLVPAPYRWLALALLAVAIWGHGWVKGAHHGELKLDAYKLAQQQADVAQENKVASVRQDLLRDAMILEGVKNDENKAIAGKLAVALADGVRLRAARQGPVPGAAPACADGTGAGLSREDAEFLDREAARANTLRTDLTQCAAQYNKARDALKALNSTLPP